jgi:hypothetical protein
VARTIAPSRRHGTGPSEQRTVAATASRLATAIERLWNTAGVLRRLEEPGRAPRLVGLPSKAALPSPSLD